MGANLRVIESIFDLTKKVPSLVSLLAFIVLNDSSGGENLHFLDLLLKSKKWGEH